MARIKGSKNKPKKIRIRRSRQEVMFDELNKIREELTKKLDKFYDKWGNQFN